MSIEIIGGSAILISIDGNDIPGVLHASIVTSNCFSSDSFAVTFAIGQPPLATLGFWTSLSAGYVEIAIGLQDGLTSQSLITGMIDSIVIDPVQHTAAIEGRDLSSSLIDSYRQQDFVNQTAAEVVSAIAQNHGLTAAVTPTIGSVGRYYGDGYTQLSLGQFSRLRSDWDLIVQLARENSFDVFVQGTTLFFQPPSSLLSADIQVTASSVQRIRVERSLTITPATSARVQSWNSQNMASYDSNAANFGANGAGPSASKINQAFLFSSSNFTSNQVTDSAGRYTTELNRLATVLHLEMPWDFSLAPRMIFLLDGTNSALDAPYRIDSVERHYNSLSGSTQSIRAVSV